MSTKLQRVRKQKQTVFEDVPAGLTGNVNEKLVLDTPERMKYPASDSSLQDLRSFCSVVFMQIESVQRNMREMVDWINSETTSPPTLGLQQMQVLLENRIREFSKWLDAIENDGPRLVDRVRILESKLDDLSHKLSEALEEEDAK